MRSLCSLLGFLVCVCLGQLAARAEDKPTDLKPVIAKNLEWLVQQQNKDGSWSNVARQSDVTCTGTAGLALLMEGSTAAKGKYAANIERAADWLIQNCQKGKDDGLLGPDARLDRMGYMSGQAYAVLFLASAYGREDKSDAKDIEARLAKARQREMEGVLKRAVQFIVKAQATKGGWTTTSREDSRDQDDAASTLLQLLALRAAQQAGIEVPKETMEKAYAYLAKMTTADGGMPFSSASADRGGGGRPGLTIAAFASTYGSEQVSVDLLKKWLKYCDSRIALQASSDQERFYLTVARHGLGDEGYAKLFGSKEPRRAWSKDRELLLRRFHSPAGMVFRGWNDSPVFGTAICLIALQLDGDHLPVFRMKKDW